MRARSLSLKLTRAGYFWPTMLKDATHYVQRCEICQKVGPMHRYPAAEMTTVVSTVPFAMWGIDLVGKLPKCKGKYTYIVVAVDYFSKWEKAKALRSITCDDILNFLWKNILTRYGIPKILVTDNGT